MTGIKCSFGIKELQSGSIDSGRNSNNGLITERKWGVFMRKGKKWLHEKKKKRENSVSLKLFNYWVILQPHMIGYWFYPQIKIPQSSVLMVRMSAFLLAFQTTVCKTMLVWPSPRVWPYSPNVQGQRVKAAPLEWLLRLHCKMAPLKSTFSFYT